MSIFKTNLSKSLINTNMQLTKSFSKIALIGLGALTMLSNGCKTSDSKPNILIIYTDDQTYNTIGALGADVKTPNIDRLVANGLTFTHAHIMGGTSGAVSMPSRAMLMTGKHLFDLEKNGALIPKEHIMMPQIFANAGYRTFGTGKWHNGRDSYARAFRDGGKIMFHGMSNHLKVPVYDFDSTGIYPPENEYIANGFSTEIFTNEAVRFLENNTSSTPFFMYVAYSAPHDPRMAPDVYEKMYPREQIKVPVNFLPQHPFDTGDMYTRDELLAPYPRTEEIVKEHIGAYYAMITHLDSQIGRLLDALEKAGESENTIIVLAGDNGLAVGQHGLMGKQNIYDHSVRVPLIISGQDIPKNSKTKALVYLNDIFPTLCEITNLTVNQDIEGKSFVELFDNPEQSFRNNLFLAYRNIQRGVRTSDNWKMIRYMVNNVATTQLFDLNTDPYETKNLINEERHSQKAAQLDSMITAYMKNTNDMCEPEKENWGKKIVYIPPQTVEHKAKNSIVSYNTQYSEKYKADGNATLTDGQHGDLVIQKGRWQGFSGVNVEVIIDLGKTTDINRVATTFMQSIGAWIFLPKEIEFSFANNTNSFGNAITITHNEDLKETETFVHLFEKDVKMKARYIKITAQNIGVCPNWHSGAGNDAWLFVDEIMID